MRTLITVRKRGDGYIMDVSGSHGVTFRGNQCGLKPYDAATVAASMMAYCCALHDDGGDLMAPPEVMDLVPEAWRNVPAKS